MKKIFNICMVLVAAAATFTACSDDNAGEQYLRENTVGVVNSNLSFDADAHQGGVKFTAPAGQTATATVNAAWAKAEVKGDSVVVNVVNNPQLESRSAMLTIKSGADSTNVPITQKGCEFAYKGKSDYAIADKDTTIVLPFSKVGAEPKLLSDNDDALAKVEQIDTAFLVTVKANTTGELRQLSLFVDNQGVQDTVSVRQAELKDFVGKSFYFTGYDLSQFTDSTLSIDELYVQYTGSLAQSGSKVYLRLPDAGMSIPLVYNQSTLSFQVKGDQLTSTFKYDGNTYRLYTSIWDLTAMDFADEYKEKHGTPINNNYFCTQYLSMDAYMNAGATTKFSYVAGSFENHPGNAAWIALLMAFANYPSTPFDANILGIDAYKLKSNGGRLFAGEFNKFYLPSIIHITGMTGQDKHVQLPNLNRASAQRAFSLCKARKDMQTFKK